ncbi:MAG: hypothetical protein GPI96_21915 [Microcystis aeruginosa BS13-02]|nr:hypothetical protein [Microcystis aeruginosa BS13-02]
MSVVTLIEFYFKLIICITVTEEPEFPDQAMQRRGLGDLSIIHDWQRICDQNPSRRVYIWSLDKHLKGYNRLPKL